jgi:hypothetical protein
MENGRKMEDGKWKMENGAWLECSAPQQSCYKFRKTDHELILKPSAQ